MSSVVPPIQGKSEALAPPCWEMLRCSASAFECDHAGVSQNGFLGQGLGPLKGDTGLYLAIYGYVVICGVQCFPKFRAIYGNCYVKVRGDDDQRDLQSCCRGYY